MSCQNCFKPKCACKVYRKKCSVGKKQKDCKGCWNGWWSYKCFKYQDDSIDYGYKDDGYDHGKKSHGCCKGSW